MGLKLTKKQTADFISISSGYTYWDDELNDRIEFDVVHRTFTDKHGWSLEYEVILECLNGANEGKYYAFAEYEPATESQEGGDFYPSEIKLIEVKPIKKMVEVTVWENV